MELLTGVLGLEDFLSTPVRSLSLGQRMRADLAAAMIHNPHVLYLDEPTIGLDVVVRENVRKAVKNLNAEFNTTVILTTHDLSDIEELCRRVMIIDNGIKVYDGTLEQIRSRFGYMRRLELKVKDPEAFSEDEIRQKYMLDANDLFSEVKEGLLHINFNRNRIGVPEIINHVAAVVEIADISILETKIEDIIKNIPERGELGLKALSLKPYLPLPEVRSRAFSVTGSTFYVHPRRIMTVFVTYYLWMAVYKNSGTDTINGFLLPTCFHTYSCAR